MDNRLSDLKYRSFVAGLNKPIRTAISEGCQAISYEMSIQYEKVDDSPFVKIEVNIPFPAETYNYREMLPPIHALDDLGPKLGQALGSAIVSQLKRNGVKAHISQTEYTNLVIDGNNLAHRAAHVYKLSHQGQNTTVAYGVLRSILGLYKKYNPYRVIVCFDKGIPDFRKKLLPTYKQKRDHHDDADYISVNRQIDGLYDFLPKFGIYTSWLQGYEADDIIAAWCQYLPSLYQRASQKALVVSGDKDLYQLVSGSIEVADPMTASLITLENFEAVTGVKPGKTWLLYRALVGDDSDGIPGVYRIGEVTGKKLVTAYPDLTKLRLGLISGRITGNVKQLIDDSGGPEAIRKTLDCIDLSYIHSYEGCPMNFEPSPKSWKYLEAELLKLGFTSLTNDDAFREMIDRFNSRYGLVGFV